jgi:hypothetical protein
MVDGSKKGWRKQKYVLGPITSNLALRESASASEAERAVRPKILVSLRHSAPIL